MLQESSGQAVLKSLYDFCAGWPLGGETDCDVQMALLPALPQVAEAQQASQS
jgi:hypothetical protein